MTGDMGGNVPVCEKGPFVRALDKKKLSLRANACRILCHGEGYVPWSFFEILVALPAFALVLLRVTGLMMTAPLLSSSMVPVRVKAAFAATISVVIFPLIRERIPASASLIDVMVGGVGEMMIGAIIGLTLSIMLSSAQVTGLLISRQAGIALADVFDPTQNQNTSVIGQIYMIMLTFVFLLVGGHRAMVASLIDTYEVVPPLSFQYGESHLLILVEALGAAFVMGIRVAGPVLIALFLVGTALGFLSRTMPQLNILTIGFTIRVVVALAVAAVTVVFLEEVFTDAVWDGLELVRRGFGLGPESVRVAS